jgi:dolichol-phosphate mannosyltransferase
MQKGTIDGQSGKTGKLAPVSVGRPEQAGIHGPGGFRLSLVLPAWNEQESIEQAVKEAVAALSAVASDYEIIVVDDGSGDHTAEIVKLQAATNPRVRLIRHPVNRGYGAALRTGFQAARFELVAFTDADCQFDLHELEYMLPLTERYDITCGYRIDRQDPARRRFFSWGFNVLVKLLLGSAVHDVDCALKIFRREAVQQILPDCNNFFANTEMLTRAAQQDLSVVEVGVHHRSRSAGESKVSLRDIPRTLATLLPFWWSRVLFPARPANPARLGATFWLCLLALAALAGTVLFTHLSYPLVEPDEARYADIGREMLRDGDWLLPHLNYVPHCDKPPLLHWLTASSLGLFGVHPWAARLVPALSAFLTILATFVFAARAVGLRAGFLAGLALALMAGFVQAGRFVLTDGVLLGWEALALFTAYEAVRGRRLRTGWWMASAVCGALAVLAKGPIALVLVAVPVVACTWLDRDRPRLRLRHWLAYGGLVLCLAAPWFVAVSVRHPEFAREFFLEHHLLRFFGPDYHAEPWWFYVPVLLVACLPWSLLLLPWAGFVFSRSPAHGRLRPPAVGFFLLWAGWCVLFFSLSRGKLPTYILPACPALAVLVGWYLDLALFRAMDLPAFRAVRLRVPRATVAVLAAVWLGAAVWLWSAGLLHGTGGCAGAVIASGVCLAVVAGAFILRPRMPARLGWCLCAGAAFAVILAVCHGIVPAWAARRSPLARVDRLLDSPGLGVVTHGEEWGSVAFRFDRAKDYFPVTESVPGRVQGFVAAHARCLVLGKDVLDLSLVRQFLPPGKEVARIIASGKARAFLVQDAGRSSAPRK